MKDSEFIELLNLYLDHEISADDAARLEAEVQSNAGRRQIYQQYCRMQKACRLLAHDFQTGVSVPEPKIVDFTRGASRPRPARAAGIYTVGGIAAAAACIAIVFIGRSRENPAAAGEPGTASQVAHAAAPARQAQPQAVVSAETPVTGGLARTASMPIHRAPASSTLAPHALSLTGNSHPDAFLAASAEQVNPQFDWIRSLELPPIPQRTPLEPLRFESQAAPLKTESRTYGSSQEVQSDFQMAAFRFQR